MSRYLALEGIEGAGKSTVARRIAQWLRERDEEVMEVREPGGTAVGEAVRAVLLDPAGRVSPLAEALLFAASRAELAAEVIGPALAEGTWVVGDRSVYSSLAYQGVGRGLGVERVRSINRFGLGEVWPDLVILLRVDPDLGLGRQEVADRFDREGAEYWSLVAKAYDDLAAGEPDRFMVVAADRPLDAVVAEVVAELEDRLR